MGKPQLRISPRSATTTLPINLAGAARAHAKGRREDMDDFNSETDSDYTSYWRDWFISSRGNEYFCEIDEDYLTDRFNLTGLNTEVQYYQYALDLVTDDDDEDEEVEMEVLENGEMEGGGLNNQI